MLQNPHLAVVIVSQKHNTVTNSSPIIPDAPQNAETGELNLAYIFISNYPDLPI